MVVRQTSPYDHGEWSLCHPERQQRQVAVLICFVKCYFISDKAVLSYFIHFERQKDAGILEVANAASAPLLVTGCCFLPRHLRSHARYDGCASEHAIIRLWYI